MPTFMTRATFDILTSVWRDLAEEFSKEEVGPSYIFVPWSGEQVAATGRGIYYVGIATDAEIAGGEPDFEAGLRGTERFCLHPTRGHAPFWRFLDSLTRELLVGPYDQTYHRWGWSNLLKVAGSKGSPGHWPPRLIERQRAACVAALQEELSRLQNSLIVVASGDEFGILHKAVAQQDQWDTAPRDSQIYVFRDVVRIARETLPPF